MGSDVEQFTYNVKESAEARECMISRDGGDCGRVAVQISKSSVPLRPASLVAVGQLGNIHPPWRAQAQDQPRAEDVPHEWKVHINWLVSIVHESCMISTMFNMTFWVSRNTIVGMLFLLMLLHQVL